MVDAKRSAAFVTVLAFALLWAGWATADMIIELRNGERIVLPVNATDIERITFGNGEKGRPSSEASAPALPKAGAVSTGQQVILVGPGRLYRLPSEAAKIARDGDIVEIDAGVYAGDAAVWRQNNLVIRGAKDGRTRLDAQGAEAEGKAIWVIKGNDVTVENVEFSGARVPDRNGAGIRFEGANLTIRGCKFYDNETGILTGHNGASDILVERSEFTRNGYGDGYSHNLYIGRVRSFTLRYSYVHHAKVGHNVKSRAQNNFILYNRLMDEATGNSSYIVDLPDGGVAYLIGNLIQQGRLTENWAAVSFAAEGENHPVHALYVVNNTFVNHRSSGVFIDNRSRAPARVYNNIFVGAGTVLKGPGERAGNLVGVDPGFVDAAHYDYRLTARSPAIDAGIELETVDGVSLVPTEQYVHPLGSEPRTAHGPIDVGAYEYSGP